MRIRNKHNASDYSVLIVDDEQLSRELLTRRLSHEGYAVTTAEDGRAATAVMAIERFDLVLLDINMPVMNGFEVLQWLYRRNSKGMRVIMLTVESDRSAVKSCLSLGADDYILKSAGIVELLQRVGDACRSAAMATLPDDTERRTQWEDFNILVVDDSSMNRKIITKSLKKLNLKIRTAGNGHEALEILQRQHIDVVLLDYHMPDIDGLEVLRRVRERWHRDEMGVVMVSAETTPALVSQFYEYGANDYIAKPFHAAALVARTKKALLETQHKRKEHYLAKLDGRARHTRPSRN